MGKWMSGALLIGNLRSSLPVARSLNRHGCEVFAGVFGNSGFVEWSRFVRGSFFTPPLHTEPEASLERTRAWLAGHPDVDAVFPVSEQAARFAAARRDDFGPNVRVIIAQGDLVARCADKALVSGLCEAHGVALARQTFVHTGAELDAAIVDIGYPVVVKGVDSGHYVYGRKAVILRSPADRAALSSDWPPEPHACLAIQRYLDGPRHNLHFAAVEGRLIGAVDAKVIRTSELDGTGYNTSCISVAPDAGRQADLERIVAALRYTGVGCAQIVTSIDGRERSFMEVNPRLGANWKIAQLCGLPLAVWAYEIAFDRPPAGFADPWTYPIGRRLVWTKGDQGAVLRALRERSAPRAAIGAHALGAIVDAFRSSHAAFDWDDPIPGLAEQANPLIKLLDPRRRDEPAPLRTPQEWLRSES